VGGAVRQFVEYKAGKDEEIKKQKAEKGILLGSGFIAGEGIAMVIVALIAFIIKAKPRGIGLVWPGHMGDFAALAAFILLVGFLYLRVRK
jgi:hypothetical protein